jgi:hypothetical protein
VTGRPCEIGGIDTLEVLDPMRQRKPGETGEQIQRAANGGVSDGVDGARNAGPRGQLQRRAGLAFGADRHAPVVASLVRGQHPGRLAPGTAVQKQLDAAPGEVGRAFTAPGTLRNQGRQLADREVKQHPEAEVTRSLQRPESLESRPPLHVMDAGHAEPDRGSLRLLYCLEQVRRSGLWHVRRHQLHRALQQQAQRLAGPVTNDPAAGRGGSGVSRPIPAAPRAALFTQAACTSSESK